MIEVSLRFLVFLIAFCSTELMAWFIHKHIMHGLLWNLHKSHHQKNHKHFFEWNDFFFLFYAILGSYLMFTGFEGYQFSFFAGLGISFYGLIYLIVHDLFIHRRVKWIKSNPSNKYLKAVRTAHRMHHKEVNKSGGEAFGLLWVSKKYFKQR